MRFETSSLGDAPLLVAVTLGEDIEINGDLVSPIFGVVARADYASGLVLQMATKEFSGHSFDGELEAKDLLKSDDVVGAAACCAFGDLIRFREASLAFGLVLGKILIVGVGQVQGAALLLSELASTFHMVVIILEHSTLFISTSRLSCVIRVTYALDILRVTLNEAFCLLTASVII